MDDTSRFAHSTWTTGGVHCAKARRKLSLGALRPGMESWRFLNSGFADGATNMAVDETLLRGVGRGTSPPTIRVYGWKPPAVSTGHGQDPSTELDLEALREAGIGVVRRPTGGRAVLHAGELTYSVAGASGSPPLGRNIAETYEAIARALVAALGTLGVRADLSPVPTAAREKRGGASPPCFVSAGRCEIVVRGRKLVGSAQRRMEGAVLQHGSVLLDASHVGLADLLRARSDEERAAIRGSLESKTSDLGTVLGRPVRFEEVAAAVRSGFEKVWGLEVREGTLSQREEAGVRALATEYDVLG